MKNIKFYYPIWKHVYKPLTILLTLSFFISMTQNSNASGFFDLFKSNPPKPPISVPFDIAKKGNKAGMMIKIVKDTGCVFGITFKYKEGDQIDRARVWKITGSPERFRNDAQGNYIPVPPEKPGIPTPVRLKIFLIINDDKSELIYDQKLDPVLGSWGSDTLTKILVDILLKPGIYKAEVESLKDSSELAEEKIEFRVINPKR